jgi:hypothetical protein
MKNHPQLFKADTLRNWDVATEIDGGWYAARPMSLRGWYSRIKLAIGVFTGKYDALEWHKQ